MDEEGITDEMKDIFDEKCEIEISSNLPYRNETQKKSWTLIRMDIVKQLGKTVFFSVIISLFGNEICKSCPYLCFLRGGKKLRWGGRLEQMKRGKKLTSVQINFFSIHLLYNF